eukprot:339602-Alexandrium_andersonii.AAC.1
MATRCMGRAMSQQCTHARRQARTHMSKKERNRTNTQARTRARHAHARMRAHTRTHARAGIEEHGRKLKQKHNTSTCKTGT